MIRRVVSTEQFDELDKCNLLCRMCHAVWTNQRFKGKLRIDLELTNGRKISKRFAFHGMVERTNGQQILHVFADDPCHLAPYTYALGNSPPLMRAGFELEKQLAKLMLATRRRKLLRVWDSQGLVFTAERVDRSLMRSRFIVRFPLMKFAGMLDAGKKPHFWVRNGKMIAKGHGVKNIGMVENYIKYESIERGLASNAINRRELNRQKSRSVSCCGRCR